MSKYFLDSDSLITSYRSYYSFDFGGNFWNKLATILRQGEAVILANVRSEITKNSKDGLAEWLKNLKGCKILTVRNNPKVLDCYAKIFQYLQNCNLYSDKALLKWAYVSIADPWIIASAMAYDYTIVKNEQSAGKITTKSGNAKIPDVAKNFGVECITLFDFMRRMNFQF